MRYLGSALFILWLPLTGAAQASSTGATVVNDAYDPVRYVESLPGCGGADYVFTGSVLDKQGQPVPGAIVSVSWYEGTKTAGPTYSISDKSGNYSLILHYSTAWTLSGFAAACPPSVPVLTRISALADGYSTVSAAVEVSGLTVEPAPLIVDKIVPAR